MLSPPELKASKEWRETIPLAWRLAGARKAAIRARAIQVRQQEWIGLETGAMKCVFIKRSWDCCLC